MRNVLAVTSTVWLSLLAVGTAQIPRKAFDLPEEVRSISKVNGEANATLPNAPEIGNNQQSLNIAPVINPGNTSLSSSGPAVQSTSPGAGTGEKGTGGEAERTLAEKLRNLEVDPAGENLVDTKRGAVWNVFDNRAVDARFERYLNLDATELQKQKQYLASLNALLQLLCPKNPYATTSDNASPSKEAMAQSYNLLRRLGSHENDHGISTVIANEVDAVNAASHERNRLYAEAERLKKEIKRLEWNQSVSLKSSQSDLGENRERNQPGRESIKALKTAEATAPYMREILRAQTLQAGKMVQAEAKLLMAKGYFQALLVQLFTQRRFQHVLIASAFYRSVFEDGELEIKTEGKIKEALTHSGAPLTVSTLESLTTEAIQEVRQGVTATKNMIQAKRFQGAEKRLAETYFIGENLPEMQSFPVEWRNDIFRYRQARREVLKAVEVKDFTRAKEKNAFLSEMATDYDPAPVQAAISGVESESHLRLAKARNAAIAGDKETMEAELKAAAAVWPQNPALAEGAQKMMDRFNLQKQALQELDQLLAASDLRGIEAKREVFTAAVATDETRQALLRAALERLMEIEKALERVKEFDGRGSPAEAWVAVEAEARRNPKDPKLLEAVTRYGAKAPDFVRYLLEARETETQGKLVRSINQYLAALKLNPACVEAIEGAQRLASQQLATL